ncbi:MAG TPA: PEP-CTERM sorting domain-containing protein [Acidobacteriaceae bacterium]|nr:PEP-CTERM sorting domain-containing protein [Acidobacteriaceae bacterium]
MRATCRLFACLLLCAFVCSAKATKINILDPYSTNPIFSTPFSVTFAACQPGELPYPGDPGFNPLGCFSGVNRTGQDWSSVELTIPDFGHSFQCDTDDSSEQYFPTPDCAYDPADDVYDLTFSGGTLDNNSNFLITEDDIDPASFPTFQVTVTYVAATPEPSALLLLGTGLLGVSLLAWSRRRSHA